MMRKSLFAFLALICLAGTPLLLKVGPAFGQCNGIFPPNTLCGNLGANPAPPAAFSGTTSVIASGVSSLNFPVTWGNTTGNLLLSKPTSGIFGTGVYDLRWSPNYNQSNVTTAFTDAINAGFSRIFMPKGSTLVNSNSVGPTVVPNNIKIWCEDPTALIAAQSPNSNSPTGSSAGFINFGSHTEAYGCSFLQFNAPYYTSPSTNSAGGTSPSTLTAAYPAYLRYAANESDQVQSLVYWQGSSQVQCGPSSTSNNGTIIYDTPCIQVIENSRGDGIYVATQGVSTNTLPGGGTGVGIRHFIDGVTGGDTGGLYFVGSANTSIAHTGIKMLLQSNGGSGNGINLIDNIANADPAINISDGGFAGTQNSFNFGYTGTTSRTAMQLFQTGGAWSGKGIVLNAGNGGGSFSGDYLLFLNNGAVEFDVNSTGTASANAFLSNTASATTYTGGTTSVFAYGSQGLAGVSCAAGTVSTATLTITKGIVTHC